VEFDDQAVDSAERVGELIRDHRPGDDVEVGVVHSDGSRDTITVTLGVNPVATG
jgi:S1-C subfamily serine protease